MKNTIFLLAIAALSGANAHADPAQLQRVTFTDCSGGGAMFWAGGSHLTCRHVTYYKDGAQRTFTFPRGQRAKLSTVEGGVMTALTNTDSKRSQIDCTIPNFDIERGVSAVVGGIGAGMGDGRGGDISRVWGRNGIVCVPSVAGGGLGGKIYLNLGWFRVPAQQPQ